MRQSPPCGEVIDAKALDVIFTDARTASAFRDKAITFEQCKAIYELTKLGPTAFNSQPLRITYIQGSDARHKLVSHLNESNRKKTLSAPLTAVLAFDKNWHDLIPTVFPPSPHLRNRFADNPEQRQIVGNNNAHLQAGYFILAVRSLGLAAGPMTGFNKESLDAAFFPAGDKQSFMVVNIGYPSEDAWHAERLPRLPLETAVSFL